MIQIDACACRDKLKAKRLMNVDFTAQNVKNKISCFLLYQLVHESYKWVFWTTLMWKKASCHDSLARYTEKHLMELTYMLFFFPFL